MDEKAILSSSFIFPYSVMKSANTDELCLTYGARRVGQRDIPVGGLMKYWCSLIVTLVVGGAVGVSAGKGMGEGRGKGGAGGGRGGVATRFTGKRSDLPVGAAAPGRCPDVARASKKGRHPTRGGARPSPPTGRGSVFRAAAPRSAVAAEWAEGTQWRDARVLVAEKRVRGPSTAKNPRGVPVPSARSASRAKTREAIPRLASVLQAARLQRASG